MVDIKMVDYHNLIKIGNSKEFEDSIKKILSDIREDMIKNKHNK